MLKLAVAKLLAIVLTSECKSNPKLLTDTCGTCPEEVTNIAIYPTDDVTTAGTSEALTSYGKGIGASKEETCKHSCTIFGAVLPGDEYAECGGSGTIAAKPDQRKVRKKNCLIR